MSRNDWEAGSIKIPARAWAPLKKALTEEWNRERESVVHLAEGFQANLADHFKGKRGVGGEMIDNHLWVLADQKRVDDDLADKAISLTMASIKKGSATQTKKLTQALINEHAGAKATSKTDHYEGHDWEIALNNDKKEVTWRVHENNHAVERARESAMGTRLFRELNRVDYGNRKQYGGVIVGNDEYNQDCDYDGGGGNYVTERFGKAGEFAVY